jgi:hypothetical protein
MPEGLMLLATTIGSFSCSGSSCSAASLMVNQSLSCVTRSSPAQQALDDAQCLVLAVALGHRVDAQV